MQRYGLVLVALTMCASAARGRKVRVDWDRATDFTPYKTYRWTKIPTPRTPTQEMEKLIHDSADVQLNARGLKKIENGEPDVYVGYSITLGQRRSRAPRPPLPIAPHGRLEVPGARNHPPIKQR